MTCPNCYSDDSVKATDYYVEDRDTGCRESGTSFRCSRCGYESTDSMEWSDPDWDDAEEIITQDAVEAIMCARASEDAIEALRRNPLIDGITAREMVLGVDPATHKRGRGQ